VPHPWWLILFPDYSMAIGFNKCSEIVSAIWQEKDDPLNSSIYALELIDPGCQMNIECNTRAPE
jgi:hypothetical protein